MVKGERPLSLIHIYDANDRPYCAGQKVLNEATRKIIAQAKANGWSRLPDEVTEPGTIEPVSYTHLDFAQGHKTGFFCDQRDNRRKFASLVKGATVPVSYTHLDVYKRQG